MLNATKFMMTAVIFAGFLVVGAGAAQARNSLKFDGFQANLNDILSGIATYCARNPGVMAFAAAGSNYRDDLFREACGTGLVGKKLPFGDWSVFYSQADHPDGRKSIFGVIKRLSYDGTDYLIAIGDEMFVRFPGQDRQQITHLPSALLNRRDNEAGQWVEIVNYARADGRGWNARDGSNSDFSVALKVPDSNVHTIWQRIVAADFGKLVRSMKDMDWPD